MQGPKRGGRPATSWAYCLQKNLGAFGAVPRKGKGRKRVAFGVVVKDGRDWMTAAKNVGMWHRGAEKGAEALDSAWRRADFANPTCSTSARLGNLYSNYVCDFVLLCLVAVVYICFLSAIYPRGVQYGVCSCFYFIFHFIFWQLTPRDVPPCVCLPLPLFDFIVVPPFPPPSFLFRCVAHSLSLSLSSYLGCLALLIWLPFLLYAYYMGLSLVHFAFLSWLSLLNPFLVMMSFADYFHTRFLLSASFLFVCLVLFCFVFFDCVRSRLVLV